VPRSDDGSVAAEGGRSALVLGWFFAKPRELDYVRRMYEKNGFTDVIVRASQVAVISKPRGWYRTVRRRLQGRSAEDDNEPTLDRHFDVVHCMSGGFLALYVLIQSGVRLRFSQLLLDSTPILPKPAAFTRFSRAYLESVGLKLPLRLLPLKLHQAFVNLRWWLQVSYIQLRHWLLTFFGSQQGEVLNRWARGPVSWAASGQYDRVATHALGTVYDQAAETSDSEIIFLYNPEDPFISAQDVTVAADLARSVGLRVKQVQVAADHVKAIFKMPRTIFSLITPNALQAQATPEEDAAAEVDAQPSDAMGMQRLEERLEERQEGRPEERLEERRGIALSPRQLIRSLVRNGHARGDQ